MKKFWILSCILAFSVTTVSLLPQTTSAQKIRSRPQIELQPFDSGVRGRYIVTLKEKFADSFGMASAIESEAGQLSSVHGGRVTKTFSSALKGFAAEMSDSEAYAMSKDPRVDFVEPDVEVFASEGQVGASWGIDRIDQRNLPLDATFSYSTDASNVHAYVIDSGIRGTHVSFGGRVTSDYDIIGDGQSDCLGHGTHVAGIIGSSTWGVAKNVRLHSVRVMGCSSSALLSDVIAGIDWVTANHQSPAVANISINSSTQVRAFASAVQSLVRSGVSVAVSAGNYNADACNYSPSDASGAITVGAVGYTDQKANYSNYGSCVDVWAPGTTVYSASNGDDTSYKVMSGTSMASPFVAGTAALYLATHPTASPSTVAQVISDSATSGALGGLDAASPNKLVFSWADGTPLPPPPTPPARVIIKKRVNSRTESVSNAAFPYDAINFAASNFSLQANNQYDDQTVTKFGTTNVITVTEASVYGFALSSISCVETAGSTPNSVNSIVQLANRKAFIVAEPGETIECTFTSDELAPTAGYASITGRVITPFGRGVRGVVLTLHDVTDGTDTVATTNSFGYYIFDQKHVSHLYMLTARSTALTPIQNNQMSFTLNQDMAAMNFLTTR